jgi:predicted outer membrane repeat protein
MNNKDSSNILRIYGSTFENCKGINGGAIRVEDVGNLYIGKGSVFRNNYAKNHGGAIHFHCQDHGLNTSLCSLNINETTFIGNKADLQGGAIYWNYYEPSMQLAKSAFSSNSAGVYGDDISGIP